MALLACVRRTRGAGVRWDSEQPECQPILSPPHLNLPGPTQDVADFEWVMWFSSFRNVILFTLSGHVLFAKLCTMVAPQVSRV